jgi:outer membrane lipoprotein-sorting protein
VKASQQQQAAIDELMQMLARVPESNASFAEVKTLAMLTRPLRASGRLAYRRPAHLEKITLEPQAESLVVDGDKLTFTEGGNASRTIDLNGEPVIHALVDAVRGTLSGDLAALRRSYAVTMTGTVANWHLTLTPSDASVARLVVRTIIDGNGTALRLVHTTQANGDEMLMTISDVR